MKEHMKEKYINEAETLIKNLVEGTKEAKETEFTQLLLINLDACLFWLGKIREDATNGRDILAGQLATAIYDEDEARIEEIARTAYERGIEFEMLCAPDTEEYKMAVEVVKGCEWYKNKTSLN